MIKIIEIEYYNYCDGCSELKDLSIRINGDLQEMNLCFKCFEELESKINNI